MWNLLKNVFRSLAKNKISVIGLTFLVFLSVGLFTVLKSTTTNIDGMYNTVSNEGNQHDFTVSELYEVGNIKLEPGAFEGNDGVGKSSDGQTVPWPKITGPDEQGKYTKTFYYVLNADPTGSSLVDNFYREHCDDPSDTEEYKLIYRTITVVNKNKLDYVNDSEDHKSGKTYEQIQEELRAVTDENPSDFSVLSSELAVWTSALTSYVSETNSPLNQYLSTDLKDQVYFRDFTSLKINNSPDQIYYDVVKSQPADSQHPYENIVDREILFKTTDFDNLGWNNFSLDDWKPSETISNRDQIKEALSYKDFPYDDLEHYDDWWNNLTENDKTLISQEFDILSKGIVSGGDGAKAFIEEVKVISNLLKDTGDFSKIKEELKNFITLQDKLHDVNDKKYGFALSYESGSAQVPFTWALNDWTSHFSIFAPQYLQKHNLKPLNFSALMQSDKDYQEWFKTHSDISTDQQRFIAWMNSLSENELNTKFSEWEELYKDNVVRVGGMTPYFILGAGITGDYAYPVVSIERPIPNTEKECILFCNESGYQRIFAAYQGNPTEKYVVGKFINKKNGKQILNEINNKCSEIMSWPQGIKAAYMANDTSCTLNAAAFRIAYISSLVDKIDLISYLLTAFVLCLGLLISGIIVNRFINKNRVTIGVMQANGVGKWSIALSLIPFALLPSIIGGIAGYVLGTALQTFAISLFSAYWTLPTSILSYSWIAMFISLIVPFVIFSAVSVVSTLWILRQKTTDLMKAGSEFKTNPISRVAKKPMAPFGIIAKFRASIAFSSLGKLFILTLISSLAMSSLIFGFTINGKFDTAIAKTADTRNYAFQVDLYSPTSQGGQYIPINDDSFGKSGFDSKENCLLPSLYFDNEIGGDENAWVGISSNTENNIKYYYKKYYNNTFSILDIFHGSTNWYQEGYISNASVYSNMFFPLMSDATGQKTDLMYARNRILTKLSLNYVVGSSLLGMSSNPWDIAAALMPETIKNTCDSKYNDLINKVGSRIFSDHALENYEKFFIDTENSDETHNYSINQSNILDFTGTGLNKEYLNLLIKVYDGELFEGQTNPALDDFELAYNTVLLNKDEETYTYLTGDCTKTSSNNKKPSNVKIIGLNENTKYMNLVNNSGDNLLNLLKFTNKYEDNVYPMVINELVAKRYNLKVGSKLSFNVTNKADRFYYQIDNKTDDSTVDFKVVGICKSYENEEYYINQQIANYILGLRSKYGEEYSSDNSYFKLHTYYEDYEKTVPDSPFTVGEGLDSEAQWQDMYTGESYTGETSTGEDRILTAADDNNNIIPYGFNGYFTNKENGGKALSNSYMFYAPSGIWLASSSFSSQATLDALKYGSNLELANIFTGISNTELGQKITDAYNNWQKDHSKEAHDTLITFASEFATELSKIWSDTAVVSIVTGANDKGSNQLVYETMSKTVTNIEVVVLVIIAFMVFFIVLLMSSIIIDDCKKLAAILSSLGYSDKENALSFMSIYIPVILLGLLISIPLSLGFVTGFQAFIMSGINLLIDAHTKWFYYLIAAGFICAEFGITILLSLVSLKKSRLVDMIK